MSCECERNKPLMERRSFLNKIVFGVGGIIGTVLSLPLIMAMLDPVLRDRGEKWRQVADLSEFKPGETKMVKFKNASPYNWGKKIADTAAYLRQEPDGGFIAFSVNCAHLGCPVRWEQRSELFLCPCHGGVYYKDGSRAAGPPPRGLYTYPVRVQGNHIEIQTSSLPITDINA